FMHPCDAAAARNALTITSTTRCDVCVFPAHTAGPADGFRKHPLGSTTSIGARHPWFRGISVPIRSRIV
ncbi:hypothetical protein KEM55_002810, partial [Ascosphaera atra]